MDQHPIPQDVTGFQFKLIGTMTVKQFGYVATGVILAVVLFYTPLGGLFGIMTKIIFIPLLAGSGVFVAFVPIEGRPVDVMTSNFFKAVFSPNQYVYRKAGRQFSFSTLDLTPVVKDPAAEQKVASTTASVKLKEQNKKGARLQAYLQSNRDTVKNPLDQKELTMLSSLGLPPPPPKPAAGTTTASADHAKHTAPVKHAVPGHTAVATYTAAANHAVPATQHPAPAHPSPIKTSTATPVAQAAAAALATPAAPVAKPTEQTLVKQETALQQQLQAAKQEETTTHAPAAHQKVLNLEKELADLHAQKQRLEQELVSLKTQLAPSAPTAQPLQQATVHAPAASAVPTPAPSQVPQQPATNLSTPAPHPAAPAMVAKPAPMPAPAAPQTPPPAVVPASQYAKTLAQPAPAKVDMPKVSDTPNVVVGTVKDPRGNILPNILVEVKDKDGNPVRAFKTNALGQFASATPLAKGVYTIELDDPKKQHQFDAIQITANNQIMLPIEITSHDAREELRKQLFTN